MIEHLNAIKDRLQVVLAARRPPILLGDATGHDAPYIVLWSGTGSRGADLSIAGACGSFTESVGATCVGPNVEQAMRLAQQVKDALTPGLDPANLPGVPGRHVVLSHFDSRPPQVDRVVTQTGTDIHPAYVVELFDLRSQPTGD